MNKKCSSIEGEGRGENTRETGVGRVTNQKSTQTSSGGKRAKE